MYYIIYKSLGGYMKLMSNYQPKLMVIIAVFYLFCFGTWVAVVQPEIALLAAKNYLSGNGIIQIR